MHQEKIAIQELSEQNLLNRMLILSTQDITQAIDFRAKVSGDSLEIMRRVQKL